MFWSKRPPAEEPKIPPDQIVHTAKGKVTQVADSHNRQYFHILIEKEDGTYLAIQSSYGQVHAPLTRVGDYVQLTYNLRYNGQTLHLLTFVVDFAKRKQQRGTEE